MFENAEPLPVPAAAADRRATPRLARRTLLALPLAALAALALAVVAVGSLLPAQAPGAVSVASPTPAPSNPAAATYHALLDVPTGATPQPTPLPASKLRGYIWPLAGTLKNPLKITLPFGAYKWGELLVDGKLFHDGLDLATECGDTVRAAHDGVVLTAGQDYADYMGWLGDLSAYKRKFANPAWKSTLPLVIVVDDGNGYWSIYAHEWAVAVKPGDRVKAGQALGTEGASGLASGCHLHYGLFAPAEKVAWQNLPEYTRSMKLPAYITARIDPLLVLPFRPEIDEMRALYPSAAAAWYSAHPTTR